MLVRIGKVNFDALLDASKQLLTWGLSRKRDIHTTCENFCFERSRDFDNHRRKFSFDDDDEDFYEERLRRSHHEHREHGDQRNFRNRSGYEQRDYRSKEFRPRQRRQSYEGSRFYESVVPKYFDANNLVKHEKNLYKPHPNVLSRSGEEIKSFYEENEIQTFGDIQCLPPILSFEELNLDEGTMRVIRNLNYSKPTPIQSMTWPVALSGMNMVGVAQTGSGKTLGFTLPGLIHARSQPPIGEGEGPIALVIAPTRELAQQTERVMETFAPSFNLKTACVFGGSPMSVQASKLYMAEVCVGTPGRLLDFLNQGIINLSRCSYFVLDEADRLLDMGFEPQIKNIVNQMRPDSQFLMWSATWPNDVQVLASRHLKEYVGVKFGSSTLTINRNITQNIHVCNHILDKNQRLTQLLEEMRGDKVLIFCQTIVGTENLKRILYRHGFKSEILHGRLTQNGRDRTLARFRRGEFNILVGTAVISRGLDIDDIKCVINYDPPLPIEDYIHVIGRTGRCGKTGVAHTFFTRNVERSVVDEYIKLLRQNEVDPGPELLELQEELRNYKSNDKRGFGPRRGYSNW